MTYTLLACIAVVVVAGLDLFVLRTRLLTKKIFWVSYAIIVFFQFITNGFLTGLRVVRYNDSAIMGGQSPADQAPPLFGDGRLFFAPIEDLLFGFALVLFTLSLWVLLGRIGIGREPIAGPSRFQPRATGDSKPTP